MNLTYDQATEVLKTHDAWGATRLYAEFKDGVYKGQIVAVKSVKYLDELTSAYRVRLYTATTHLSDLVKEIK